jgi:hypothetical protein
MVKIIRAYKDSAVKASIALCRNWIVLPGILLSYVVFTLVASIAAPLGIAGGFIIGMTAVALISLYYLWVQQSIDSRRIRFKELLEFDAGLFFHVMSIAFIFWIVLDLLLGSVSQASGDGTVRLVAQLAAFLLFNAIPETLYRKRLEGIEALVDCFNFIKENWIEWFVPLVIILGPPLLLLRGEDILITLATSQPLVPFTIILSTWPFSFFSGTYGFAGGVIDFIPALIICHWFMLFRGYLFEAIQYGRTR